MAYKWGSPAEWLIDKAESWDQARLYRELCNLARELDSDTLQDTFQDEMDADGYFEPNGDIAVNCENCGRELTYVPGKGCGRCHWVDEDEQVTP